MVKRIKGPKRTKARYARPEDHAAAELRDVRRRERQQKQIVVMTRSLERAIRRADYALAGLADTIRARQDAKFHVAGTEPAAGG